jgi:hypothetical protein
MSFFSRLFAKRKAELDEEIQAHLSGPTARNCAHGPWVVGGNVVEEGSQQKYQRSLLISKPSDI